MSSDKSELLVNVEQIVLELIRSLMCYEKVALEIPKKCRDWYVRDDYEILFGKFRKIVYNSKRSRHRFCLIVYLLAEIHCLHLTGGSCTIRGLYYRNTQVIRSQSYIDAAKMDVCRMLNTAPVNLGILSASKGLITGVKYCNTLLTISFLFGKLN